MGRTFYKSKTQINRDRKVPLQMEYFELKFCTLKPGFSFLEGPLKMNAIARKMRYQESENVHNN